jgi:tRNA U34 2-thiouridine synthase MnmA/TrmU
VAGPRAGLGVFKNRKVSIEHGGKYVYHLLQLQNDLNLLNHSLYMFYLIVRTNRVYLGKGRALTIPTLNVRSIVFSAR